MPFTFLDYINLSRIWLQTCFPEFQRWRKQGGVGGIRVFYGFDEIPRSTEQAGGGIIKVQDLEVCFPNCRQGADILYLISSALPYHAVRMAKLARRSGAAVVINQNGVAYPAWFGKGWKEHNRPMRRLIELADHVFYQSRFCRACADKFLVKPRCSSEILYNPVDTKIFEPPKDRPHPGRKPRLLIAGSHWSHYRPRIALEVLRHILPEYPEATLIIAGPLRWEADQRLAYLQLIDDMDRLGVSDHVQIIGPYSQRDAVGIFQNSHLLLHTKYNDPCPRLVVEAMACGLPVVYSATGGVPEIVGRKAGIGVPAKMDWLQDHPPDAERMALGVKEVLCDWKTFSQAARHRAQWRFDVTPWLHRHQVVFNRIYSRKGR